jgi:xanthine dehydrogenase FAD-binding subunit
MNPWSKYIVANSVEEALTSLSSAPGPALPVAGGTDLMLDLQQLPVSSLVHTLVDVTNIPEMNCLELRGTTLFIGASVPVKVVTESSLIQQHAMALSEACGLIGGPQVRNTATLGGNVAHALPAADGTIALVALNAIVEIAGPSGRRMEPILNIFQGVGRSNLVKDREILVGFHIAKQLPGQASAFGRVMRPQGVALPVLNLAVLLHRNEKRIGDIRIAVGPAGPTPQRAFEIEKLLRGALFSDEIIQQAQVLVDSTMQFRTSPMRASSRYRYHLCKVLLNELLNVAWKRASFLEQK